MKIKIHRGANQIGGCITEIESSKGDKILIDFGHNLPEGDEKADDKYENSDLLREVLQGVSDVYYTHYHGDHIGFEYEIYKAGVTQHIGGLSLKMMQTLKTHMQHTDGLKDQAADSLAALEHFKVYRPARTEQIGDISITPYFVSHSAVDAHMFLIECDGVTILHTGDFRDHGYMGGGLEKNIKANIVKKNVDVLITEGTMLARGGEKVLSEWDLQEQAMDVMKNHKYAFVLCSSTDADRIVTMFKATQRTDHKRLFVVDSYQGAQILNIKDNLDGIYKSLYFKNISKDYDKLLPQMLQDGFTMLVRNSQTFENLIEKIVPQIDLQQTAFIYSQFGGYIDESHTAFRQSTYDFVHKHDWKMVQIHTSGHASCETLNAVCELLRPSLAIVPIHKDSGTSFADLLTDNTLKQKVVTQTTSFCQSSGNEVEIIVN